MKTKHTQGEWVVYVPQHVGCTNVAIGGDKYFGQFVELWHHQNSKEQSEANANLISAAPDLLEALESVASDLFYQIESTHGAKSANKYPSITQAQKAIKKAKGE
jgi:hypothetical protein